MMKSDEADEQEIRTRTFEVFYERLGAGHEDLRHLVRRAENMLERIEGPVPEVPCSNEVDGTPGGYRDAMDSSLDELQSTIDRLRGVLERLEEHV